MSFLLGTATEVDALLGDAALLEAMVATEVALLRAAERAALVPPGCGDALAGAARANPVDPATLAAGTTAAGNPVPPLVNALLAVVPEPVRPWVHHGATSQDVLDTALMLLAARACDTALGNLDAACAAAADLADRHRETLQVGRTLGQHAVPTTFGVTAAGWALGLHAARRSLARVRDETLAVQLGGAAGTLGVYGAAGPAVVAGLAEELGLAAPAAPWHTERSRVRDLAAALGSVVAAAGKVATDVAALSATEVGEVAEGGGEGHGGSSAMPHKRNPVTSVLVRAAALRAPGLVGTLYAASLQEHQRAAGGWHAEWQPLLDLLSLAGGAASRTAEILAGLHVDAARMSATLDAARPAVMAEQLSTVLKPRVGRGEAQRLVAAALAAGEEDDVVAHLVRSGAGLSEAEIRSALDPRGTTAACGGIVDRALHEVAAGTRPEVPSRGGRAV
ncbi:adenylosuccinate lyase [Georgenia sp. EYE_87]|uniref:lyase family protein n=1 Tax=Georgenia sp. EYE_87 TaxID=2853448 RepID=UPI0020069EC6|nr:lyase family protein [Georgenia sp. EYE_87]MCK6209183.1 adenylosuccinate lyase [Georgenia sp. EYE_87]